MQTNARDSEALVKSARVLIVDDEYYTRKVIRTLLLATGVANVHDAADGRSGLDAIHALGPDVVILDWEMPGMDGAEFVRIVRSPNDFPYPNVPIIMLTGHGERSRVMEAVRLGVHEFLLKPVSSTALYARLVSVLTKPRTMVRRGDYYGPEPRKMATYKPQDNAYDVDPPPQAQPEPRPETKPAVDRPPSYMIFVN